MLDRKLQRSLESSTNQLLRAGLCFPSCSLHCEFPPLKALHTHSKAYQSKRTLYADSPNAQDTIQVSTTLHDSHCPSIPLLPPSRSGPWSRHPLISIRTPPSPTLHLIIRAIAIAIPVPFRLTTFLIIPILMLVVTSFPITTPLLLILRVLITARARALTSRLSRRCRWMVYAAHLTLFATKPLVVDDIVGPADALSGWSGGAAETKSR